MPQIETVEVYVDRPVALDPRLTTPPEFPPAPAPACLDARTGEATLCEEQLHAWVVQIGLALRQAISQIDGIRQLQPTENIDE